MNRAPVKHRNIKYKNRISKVSSYFSSAPNKHFKLIDPYSTLARRKIPVELPDAFSTSAVSN